MIQCLLGPQNRSISRFRVIVESLCAVPLWVRIALILVALLIGLVASRPLLAWLAFELRFYVRVISIPVLILLMIGIVAQVHNEALRGVPGDTDRSKNSRWRRAEIIILVLIFFGMNMAVEIAAAQLKAHWDGRRQDGVDVYRNHDLSALVGQCVRLAMLRHAERVQDSSEAFTLRNLARSAPAHWNRLTLDGDPRIVALAESKLSTFVQDQRQALHPAIWLELLQEWRGGGETGRKLPSDTTLLGGAQVLAEDFGITLRESLKTDFTKGGRAWAALQLDIAQRLLNRTPLSSFMDDKEMAEAFSRVSSLLADDAVVLPELRRVIFDVRQSHDAYAQEVLARLTITEAVLDRIKEQIDVLMAGQKQIIDYVELTQKSSAHFCAAK